MLIQWFRWCQPPNAKYRVLNHTLHKFTYIINTCIQCKMQYYRWYWCQFVCVCMRDWQHEIIWALSDSLFFNTIEQMWKYIQSCTRLHFVFIIIYHSAITHFQASYWFVSYQNFKILTAGWNPKLYINSALWKPFRGHQCYLLPPLHMDVWECVIGGTAANGPQLKKKLCLENAIFIAHFNTFDACAMCDVRCARINVGVFDICKTVKMNWIWL